MFAVSLVSFLTGDRPAWMWMVVGAVWTVAGVANVVIRRRRDSMDGETDRSR